MLLLNGLLLTALFAVAMSNEECIQREIDPKGGEYRGKAAKTITGHKCRIWGYQAQSFPNSGLDDNLCRNPGNAHDEPWCHSDDSEGYASCYIPDCPVLECINVEKDRSGRKYRGHTDTDRHGKKCMDWSETKHTPELFPNAGLGDGNYCRNPPTHISGFETFRNQPWCYTSTTTISYCDIPDCEEPTEEAGGFGLGNGCIPYAEDPVGEGYRADKRVTVSGRYCVEWGDFFIMMFPKSGLEKPACRNPDGKDSRTWCFVGPSEYDYCDIDECVERDLECSEGELMCLGVEQCIKREQNCDGVPDCDDESDEKDC